MTPERPQLTHRQLNALHALARPHAHSDRRDCGQVYGRTLLNQLLDVTTDPVVIRSWACRILGASDEDYADGYASIQADAVRVLNGDDTAIRELLAQATPETTAAPGGPEDAPVDVDGIRARPADRAARHLVAERIGPAGPNETDRDVAALLTLVDELTARLRKSVTARDLLDVVAQRRTALVRLAAAETRIAELEARTATADVEAHPSEDAYLVEQQDPLLLDEPDGGWGPATSVQPNEAVMRDLMRVNRERVPGRPPMRVVRRRLSWTVVATEDTPSGETAPESPQNATAHPETRETGGSAA